MAGLQDEFTFGDEDLDFSELDKEEVAAYHRRVALASRGQKSQSKPRSVVISNIALRPAEEEDEEQGGPSSQPFVEFGSEEAKRFRGKGLLKRTAPGNAEFSQNSDAKGGSSKRNRTASPDAQRFGRKALRPFIRFACGRNARD